MLTRISACALILLIAAPCLAQDTTPPHLIGVTVSSSSNNYEMHFDEPLDPAFVSGAEIFAVYEWGYGNGDPFLLKEEQGGAALILSTASPALLNGNSTLRLWLAQLPSPDSWVVTTVHHTIRDTAGNEVTIADSVIVTLGNPTGDPPGSVPSSSDVTPPSISSVENPSLTEVTIAFSEAIDMVTAEELSRYLIAGTGPPQGDGEPWPWDGAGWADYRPYMSPIDQGMKDHLRAVRSVGDTLGRVTGRMGQIGDSIKETQAYYTSVMVWPYSAPGEDGPAANETGHDYGDSGNNDPAPPGYVPDPSKILDWLGRDWNTTHSNGKGGFYGNQSGWNLFEAIQDGHPAKGVNNGDYSWVIIMYGTNDVQERAGDINSGSWKTTYADFVQGYLDLGVIPVVSTIPPRLQSGALHPLVPVVNAAILEVAAEKNVPWVDLFSLMIDLYPNGTEWMALMEADGIHLGNTPGSPFSFSRDFTQAGLTTTNGNGIHTKLTYDIAEKLRAIVFEDGPAEVALGAPIEIDLYGAVSDGANVTLTTGVLEVGAQYSVTVVGVADTAGNAISAAGVTGSFVAQPPRGPNLADTWHVPAAAEPVGLTMRNPHPDGMTPSTAVEVYVGSQFQGAGSLSNMTGGTFFHRIAGVGPWNAVPMSLYGEEGDYRYLRATLSPGSYAESDSVEYYFETLHEDHDPTYVGAESFGPGNEVFPSAGEAEASPFAFAFGLEPLELAHTWHRPASAEPVGAFMRNPPGDGNSPRTDVDVYCGTQFAGIGELSDQTAGMFHHREVGGTGWTSLAMSFHSETSESRYFRATIPSGTYSDSSAVEYYLEAIFSDHATTFLAASADSSVTVATSGEAMSSPFVFAFGSAPAVAAQAWHVPERPEPTGASMRNPPGDGTPPNQLIEFYCASIFQGLGGRDQTSAILHHRPVGGGWAPTAGAFAVEEGDARYFLVTLPADTYGENATVEYYFELGFADNDTTYLAAVGDSSAAILSEGLTQTSPFLLTYGENPPDGDFGNAWHDPFAAEPAGEFMRNPPSSSILPNTDLEFFLGIQVQGPGNAAAPDVLTIFYREVPGAWQGHSLDLHGQEGDNEYWKRGFLGGAFADSSTVEYYFRATFFDHDITYVTSNALGDASVPVATESEAMARPFAITFEVPGPNPADVRHIPAIPEPVGSTMRTPPGAVLHPGAPITVYTGSETPDQTGGSLWHRLAGALVWSGESLTFYGQENQDDYWSATLPGDTYPPDSAVEYYVETTFAEHDVTYIAWDEQNSTSQTFTDEESARTSPFRFDTLSTSTAVEVPSASRPSAYRLAQNSPNPFNPVTVIEFDLPRASRARLDVFDVAGRRVQTLLSPTQMPAGRYRSSWDGRNDHGDTVASGVYLYRFECEDFTTTRRMTLLK